MNESRYCKDNLDLLNLVHCTSVPGVPQEQEGDETPGCVTEILKHSSRTHTATQNAIVCADLNSQITLRGGNC